MQNMLQNKNLGIGGEEWEISSRFS